MDLMFSKPTTFSLNDYSPKQYFSLSVDNSLIASVWTHKKSWSKSSKRYSIKYIITPHKDFKGNIYIQASGSNDRYAEGGEFFLSVRQQQIDNFYKDLVYERSQEDDESGHDHFWLNYNNTLTIEFIKGKPLEIILDTPTSDMNASYSLGYTFTSIWAEYNGHSYQTGRTYQVPTIPNKIYIGNINDKPILAKEIYYGKENNKPERVWTAPTT